MGLFDSFKSPNSTIEGMCKVFNSSISKGCSPKSALVACYDSISDRDEGLKYVGAEMYFHSIFKEKFERFSLSPATDKQFVKSAIENIVAAYLYRNRTFTAGEIAREVDKYL
jgi:hypothetical protein